MRILLVEDERKIAQFIAKGLQEEGYAVDHAINAEAALSMTQAYEYDLIISDILMPGMNGLELVKKLRDSQVQCPIIMLSAKNQVDDKIIGLDSGADDYLSKPFAFNELLARVRALLRRNSAFQEKLSIADLIMEPAKHTVSRAGKNIELTPKEYALLEFLLRNKNRVLTRTSIIEHVWDMHFDSDTNLVDVFMTYLRKKIEIGFPSRLIHSVRGVGYIMKEMD